MARNSLAGQKKGSSASARRYQKDPEARAKKLEYDKEYQKSKSRVKYRSELNKYNREKGTYGNHDGKDASHKGSKIAGFESAKVNRARKTNTKKKAKSKK